MQKCNNSTYIIIDMLILVMFQMLIATVSMLFTQANSFNLMLLLMLFRFVVLQLVFLIVAMMLGICQAQANS